MARDIGRTRAELLATTSEIEITLWRVLMEVEAEETEKAAKERAKS